LILLAFLGFSVNVGAVNAKECTGQFGALINKLGMKAVPVVVKQEGLKLKISEVALK
jgi:hypothetical protein